MRAPDVTRDADAARPDAPSLVALDRAIVTAGGVWAVQAESMDVARALGRHVQRRARAAGRDAIVVDVERFAAPWSEVARQLGVAERADRHAFGVDLVAAASRLGVALVVSLDGTSAWDAEIARAVASAWKDAGPTIVVAAPTELALGTSARALTLSNLLAPAEVATFWEAIAIEARTTGRSDDLVTLDRWWNEGVRLPRGARPLPPMSLEARDALALLVRARVAWPERALDVLAAPDVIDELVRAGLVVVERGALHAVVTPAISVDPGRVARALSAAFPADAWAQVRAAEAFADAGEPQLGLAPMREAFRRLGDPDARAEATRRWRDALSRVGAAERAALALVASAEALARGDADDAWLWANDAVDGHADLHAASLALGRAALARGDLVSALAALRQAGDRAPDVTARARVDAEVAECRYLAGDLAAAGAAAESARASAGDDDTRLVARNLLGKLLLARGAYADADAHFAMDELDAGRAGLPVAALRARVNRAIAALSRGRADEARPMLESVLEEGERASEPRAIAFALSNLAVLAIQRHAYGEALRLSERAIEARRRTGDRIGLARAIGNLAELRLRVGLVKEAAHAVAFARRAMSPGMPASRVTELALVHARVLAAEGRTEEASRELARALSHAAAASDGEKASECHRAAARLALDDGDVARARAAVEAGAEHARGDVARAEVAVLRALVARAAGEACDELADGALALARAAGDDELSREAHLLAAEVERAAGRTEAARRHLAVATALRDRVAESLDDTARARWAAKPDVARVEALASALADEAPTATPTLRAPRDRDDARRIVGDDPAIRALLGAIRKVARTDATVLVHGESGTGKELVAEAIHAASERAAGPLVKVNCGALVDTLLLSELFGHEKGAFTGAQARRRGRFELADGGTLFLDEIGDISARTQVALLRVLQERAFERVGGTTTLHADVRIVCATHRDLRAMVERGEFREDLYYRLRGVTLVVPPLRERLGDLPALAARVLDRVAVERDEPAKRLSAGALALLRRHRWPGNVRELENVLRAVSLFAEGTTIEAADLAENVDGLRDLAAAPASVDVPREPASDAGEGSEPLPVGESSATEVAYLQIRGGTALGDLKRQIERDCIARALGETQGNITRAAALLGMKRPRLSQLVKQYGLHVVSEGS